MLRVEVCDGARRRTAAPEVRGEVHGGSRRRMEARRGGELTGFSAYGAHKSPYLQNKSFLAS